MDWITAANSTLSRLGWGGRVWHEGTWPTEGEYNWDKLDEYVEAYTSKGLKLIVAFSYMPRWLWSDPDDPELNQSIPGSIFDYMRIGNTLPPGNYEKWEALIYQTVRHLNVDKKYGVIFEGWNEPNIDWFWNGTMEQYVELYESTARAVKRADPNSMFGGPAIAGGPTIAGIAIPGKTDGYTWMEAFIKHFAKNDVPLDFISWHYYEHYAIEADRVSSFTEQAGIVRELIEKYPAIGDPIGEPAFVIDEWGYDWNYRDRQSKELIDSPFHAAWVTQYLYDMVNSGVDAAAYTSGLGDSLDAPNPTFGVFEMFNRLGSVRLKTNIKNRHSEVGVLASIVDGNLSILVWGYPGRPDEIETGIHRICITLDNLPAGTYKQTRYLANHTRTDTGLKIVEDKRLQCAANAELEFELETYDVTLLELTADKALDR